MACPDVHPPAQRAPNPTIIPAMSNTANPELWTEEAVINNPEWENVRSLAKNTLDLLGWEGEPLTWEQYSARTHNRG